MQHRRTVSVPIIEMDKATDLQGLKIGIPDEYFITGIQPEVEQAVRQAIKVYESLGVEVIPINLPHTEYALPVYYIIAPAEASANLARYDSVRFGHHHPMPGYIEQFKETRGEGFGPEVKRRIMLGTYALSAGYYDAFYGQAQKVRTLIKRISIWLSNEWMPSPRQLLRPRPSNWASTPAIHWRCISKISLPFPPIWRVFPGLAFPVGFDSKKLPIGMQLMGKSFQEDVLLRMAHAYQQETGWHKMRPEPEIE